MVDIDKLLRATTPKGKCACGHAKRSHTNSMFALPCRFCACKDFKGKAS